MTAPNTPPRTLVLWDVDHTLIETRGVGRAIYDRAFPAATGRPLAKLAQISGRTELDIMAESLRVNGLEPTDEAVKQLAAALVQGYEDARQELAITGRALPGAREALEHLAADPANHQGILTGNLREVARIKLEVFGLDQYLDFEASAFGDDHADRPELVRFARERAEAQTGARFELRDVVLIGDTPNDVKAALTAGVRVVGVATGKSTEADLAEAGASASVRDLTDLATLRRLLASDE
ncbi:haloacid dehalogenase [Amycolatopsis mediterranei S699]|uniref:Haloacid dehalogenase-like hydrolase n=2 Tax=Amycolatopsis mediterranei TaxID=33910 RepID=A0A0H3DE61_AMYMU|nr:haloacid dehalogenase-like hydrolase [Amycolatopsis mediterranei]ADJ48517.1 haloacid dehalogenase-like hydrolase [Amycolatopsis mediterranei U32]AEK45444.1 haloacid dehalogenase [Amycolatopsis mediterranei S699]AFO80226.1 haloacid dehalogenase [Amycolatopsis mediterranei S699]AGT87354.1 haloacid dehalogenase [Amycolatopsis mediterranei RB]KDO11036.1 haloacid dehalogenase [Amycolatopsis mediterranei]